MKKQLTLTLALMAMTAFGAPKVIIDTDIGSSTDDLFAL